jgi:hypothetical protein
VNAYFAAVLLASSLAATAHVDNPLTGEWKVRNDIASNVSEMTCSFTQKGEELTGGCATDQGNVEIAGKVVESSVSWVFKSAYNGSPITLTYKGSLGTDGQLAGAVTVEEFSVTGDFTATPVKK